MLSIPALERLVHELSRLPGVGQKTAQRLAYYILRAPEFSHRLRAALEQVELKVHLCPKCFNYTDEEFCRYCQDPHRQDDLICVVEEPSDIHQIESSGAFRGRYHVLHGALSPLEGITPQDLHIRELVEKIKAGQEGRGARIHEVILAVDVDLEGDTTVLYLGRLLRELSVKVTRIAQGVPIGGHIDYIDDRTLGRALQNRVEL
jgi:recombination protein RecR